jgi:Zn finger protein HypA/HybF involved in hydrogenase expression
MIQIPRVLKDYYVLAEGVQHGPMKIHAVWEMYWDQAIRSESLFRTGDSEEWIPLWKLGGRKEMGLVPFIFPGQASDVTFDGSAKAATPVDGLQNVSSPRMHSSLLQKVFDNIESLFGANAQRRASRQASINLAELQKRRANACSLCSGPTREIIKEIICMDCGSKTCWKCMAEIQEQCGKRTCPNCESHRFRMMKV